VKDTVFSASATVAKKRLRPPVPVVVLAAICTALGLAGEAGRQLGRYERAALEASEYWRLVSAHLVHLGWGHLWPNVLALLILGVLFEDVLRARHWVAVGLVSAAAIDAGLYLLDPGVAWYVGLSGVLHGFMAAGAVMLMLRGDTLGALLAMGLCVKLVYEQIFGPLPFTAKSTGGPVITAAHLYGAAGGFVTALASYFFGARRSRL
jgi:rhomboid family GlyGly-CTERM serine protease